MDSGSAAAGALELEKNTDFDVLVSLSLAVLSLSLLLSLIADFFGGICNRLVFNDGYSFLCLLPLDGLVLDELSFGIDDENFIKTIRSRKTMRTIGEAYDLWSLLRLIFGSREDRWQLVRSLVGAI